MPVLLVRHAVALARSKWAGDDDARPLNERGRRQADALPEQLAAFPVSRCVSSPTVRCVDTVAPTAAALGLEIARDEDLCEGKGTTAVRSVLSWVDADEHVVVCTHGDVVGDVLTAMAKEGADLGDDDRCQKGSTWVLERGGDGRIHARYLDPPT